MSSDLSALADYAAHLWLREQRRLAPPVQFRGTLGWSLSPEARADRREHAVLLRKYTLLCDWLTVLDELGPVGNQQFQFLRRAWQFMSLDERGTYLGYVWQRCKDRRPRISSVLPMFKNATTLRAMVPQDWPPIISVYRGSWCHEAWPQPERRARRWLRSGISWTTDRNVALTFAEDPMGGGVGVIGSATVARDAVLAYFHDVGDSGSGTYHEHECIIDPTSIDGVVYDRVIAEATADAGIGGGTVGI